MTHSSRKQFPFFDCADLNNGAQGTIYLDSAATSQKCKAALNAMDKYNLQYSSNVHRGGYKIAQQATEKYEQARSIAKLFINAQSSKEIVFTSGATEAINIIAAGLSVEHLKGKEILICGSEHHANLVPWQMLAKQFNLSLKIMPLAENGHFDDATLKVWLAMISENTAILACAHVSNVLGNIYPVASLCSKAKSMGALSIIDGTQAGAHISIDVQEIDCDFYVLSGHKMYASTGIGVLYGKYKLLNRLLPRKFGGEMIRQVSWESSDFQAAPLKFEGGTPNIAGALSLAAAMNYIQENAQAIEIHEKALYKHLLQQISKVSDVKLLGNIEQSIALLSFVVEGIHAHDIAIALAHKGIALRAGHHCAMPLMNDLKVEGTLRISLACYNEISEITQFVKVLNKIITEHSHDNGTQDAKVNKDLSFDSSVEALRSQFSNATGWNEKHRLLLLQSKNLPLLAESNRIDVNFVAGCESSVWIEFRQNKFMAYSNSKVVRGLLAVLLIAVNEALLAKANSNDVLYMLYTPEYQLAYIESLGLPMYFSQGRRDGMVQVVKRISQLLSQHEA